MFLRTLTTICVCSFVAMLAIAIRSAPGNRASAAEFRPIKEADMPAGFPDYTPVGQIEVKRYPAYRKAFASGAGEFWALFRHIKQNDVKMTAPVEMDFGDPRANESANRAMAFLYERPDQGSSGKQGRVEVIDVPAMQVVSIGCRGSQTARAVAEAREKLLKYLAENKDRYEISGPMRVMGYNSPFVPRDRNFFEVQIPVKSGKTG